MLQPRMQVKIAKRNQPPKAASEVTVETLQGLCWKRGYRGVTGLAEAIGRSRVTVHRAVKRPHLSGPTYRLVCAALSRH